MSNSVAGEESRSEQIIRVATQLFCEKTYHGASVKDIADAVGILKSSLYYYFDSKESLLVDIIMKAASALKEDLSRLESADLTPVEELKQIIWAHVKFNTGYRETGFLWLTEQHVLSSLNIENVKDILKHRNRLLEKTLSKAISAGIYSPMDLRMASLAIVGLCNSVLAWYRPIGRLNYEEIAEFFFKLVHNGLSAGNYNDIT